MSVLLQAGLLTGDLQVVFELRDALLDAAQLFREYQKVGLIAGLLRGHQPRFRQCGTKAVLNAVNGAFQFACNHR